MIPPAVVVLTLSTDELRALVRAEFDAALAARAVAPPTMPFIDRRELARTLDVSLATVTRMTAEGMPHIFVGASRRYSVDDVRKWLDERGRRGTQAAPSKGEIIPGVRLLSRRSQ